MNKELQNLAWSILPKEFKEEVKKEYRKCLNEPWCVSSYLRGRLRILRELFGEHNLTSDAEGEEMLTVTRSKVQEVYKTSKEIVNNEQYGTCLYSMHTQIMCVLENLFGSKCLPDDTKGPKLSEPKFTKGNMVHCKSFGYEGDYKVLEYAGGPRNCYDCIDKYGAYYRFYESDLEPYTEPENESRNLSKNIANCDKQLDNILKNSFSKERRLNIAVQMVKAITQCPEIVERIASAEADSLLDDILHDALYLTDRLMSECEKGGKS